MSGRTMHYVPQEAGRLIILLADVDAADQHAGKGSHSLADAHQEEDD